MLKNYKFGIVSKEIMTNPEISVQAKSLYSLLSVYCNKKRKCFPSITRLADELNVSERYISILIKELKEKKVITKSGRVTTIK